MGICAKAVMEKTLVVEVICVVFDVGRAIVRSSRKEATSMLNKFRQELKCERLSNTHTRSCVGVASTADRSCTASKRRGCRCCLAVAVGEVLAERTLTWACLTSRQTSWAYRHLAAASFAGFEPSVASCALRGPLPLFVSSLRHACDVRACVARFV